MTCGVCVAALAQMTDDGPQYAEFVLFFQAAQHGDESMIYARFVGARFVILREIDRRNLPHLY